MADRFEDLRTFVTIVTAGGVNAAAAELGIAKSAVSRRLSDLEARLGVTLIERSTRSFEITTVGREYFRQAADILAAIRRLDAGVSAPHETEVVTIAAALSIHVHLLVPAIAALRASGDLARISLVAETADADVTITERPDLSALGDLRPLLTTRKVVCASPEYMARNAAPETPAGIEDHDGIVLEGAETWTFGTGTPRRPRVAVTVPDFETALAAALGGLGLAQLPDYVAAGALRAGRLRPVLDAAAPAAGELTAHVARSAGHAVRHLVDGLARELKGR